MQVSLEKISVNGRRLTIIVPAERVEEAYGKQIHEFAKNAKIKGFRPGKVPMAYVEQRFGHSARQEALSEIMQKSLFDAITEQQLKPINTPEVHPKVITPNQPFEFTATFEVLPEIGTVKFDIDHIEKLQVEVKAEDVERVLNQLQKQYAQWTSVERAAKVTDRVVIDYEMAKSTGDDKLDAIISPSKNFPLELGSHSMIPGFEEGLIGLKAGSDTSLDLSFPKDYHQKELAGKPVSFKIHINQVFQADVPEFDQDFVIRLGVKSGALEELKTQIKQSLEQERDRLVKEKLKEQIFQRVLELNPLEVPEALVQQEAKHIHDEVYPQDRPHDHHQHSAEELSGFSDIAKKRVSLGLLIAEFAKQVGLEPDKARVKARIEEIASAYEDPKAVIAWLSSAERRSNIESQVMEDQVLDKLMEGAKIIEKSLSYAELKGIRI